MGKSKLTSGINPLLLRSDSVVFEEISHDVDRILDEYFAAKIEPVLWMAKGPGGFTAKMLSAFWTVTRTRSLRSVQLEEMLIKPIEGPEQKIMLIGTDLRVYRIPDPPLHPFGVFAVAPRPPDIRTLITDAFKTASSTGDFRMIQALEWAQLVSDARLGTLKPHEHREPAGLRWIPLRPHYPAGQGTLVYWGLIDPAADRPVAQGTALTNTDGQRVSIVRKPGGGYTVELLDRPRPNDSGRARRQAPELDLRQSM